MSSTSNSTASRRARLRRRLTPGPGMAVYLLSPVIAELMLGSSPPLLFALLSWTDILMYGGGAILIRELAVRWGKGWPTIVALGVAYGIAEEGVALRTFFNHAATSPAADYGAYGWLGGANWVFITGVLLYHAFVSIALPIMLVTMAFPDRAREPWVSARWLRRSTVGLVGIVALWLLIYQVPISGGLVVACLTAIPAIVWVARRLPEKLPFRAAAGLVPSPRRVAAVVAFSIVGIAFANNLKIEPFAVSVAGQLLIATLLSQWIGRASARPDWTDRHRFAVAVGVFVCMWILSPFVELGGGHGQLIVTALGIWVARHVWVRLKEREAGPSAVGPTTWSGAAAALSGA